MYFGISEAEKAQNSLKYERRPEQMYDNRKHNYDNWNLTLSFYVVLRLLGSLIFSWKRADDLMLRFKKTNFGWSLRKTNNNPVMNSSSRRFCKLVIDQDCFDIKLNHATLLHGLEMMRWALAKKRVKQLPNWPEVTWTTHFQTPHLSCCVTRNKGLYWKPTYREENKYLLIHSWSFNRRYFYFYKYEDESHVYYLVGFLLFLAIRHQVNNVQSNLLIY